MEAHAGARVVAPPPLDLEAERYWRAVVERDQGFDGQFVYAVETTTVYCRPSCPSRRPLRRNVRFLPSAEAAERQGYRACRRCHPRSPLSPSAAVVERVRALLSADAERAPTLAELGRRVSMSPGHLQRLFTRATGMSPKAYVEAQRLARLKSSLRHEDGVTEAIYAAGYGAPSRAYEKSRSLGMTPSAYRAGGAGQRISYALADSSLGRALVASTRRGVCRVAFGGTDEALVAGLREEFPAAELGRAEGPAARWAESVVQAVDAPGKSAGIPLDISGTAFQLRVWKALRKIPAGRTASYAEVARAIRSPRAVRAVARACASNPVAVLVPCHRVVRSDGGLGGYRWGEARKEQLLARERSPGR